MNQTDGTLIRQSRLKIITVRSSGTKLKMINLFMLKTLPSRAENLSAVSRTRAVMNV